MLKHFSRVALGLNFGHLTKSSSLMNHLFCSSYRTSENCRNDRIFIPPPPPPNAPDLTNSTALFAGSHASLSCPDYEQQEDEAWYRVLGKPRQNRSRNPFTDNEVSRFQGNQHMKTVRSDLRTGHLYPQKIFLV